MAQDTQKKKLRLLSLSGAIGVAFYTAHVIIGGFLWDGYSHVRQTISELTATGAPNADFLRVLTAVYGLLLVIFAICTYVIFRKKKLSKISILGAFLLIIMEFFSFAGYSLFPLDQAGSLADFQNIMHIIVTAVVVICTIASSYCIGIGLMRSSRHRKIGVFIFICAIIITVSGIMTPVIMANKLLISGLTERINIFSLQTWIFALSVYLFADKEVLS